jgi:opacity protein-like surface antigen
MKEIAVRVVNTGDPTMKIAVTAALAWMVCCAVAQAQTGSAPDPAGRGYAEVVAQSAFGNVTSQSYGGEIGVTVRPQLQIFVDAGRVANVAPNAFGASALLIAGFLSQTQSNVVMTAREPVTFGLAGARYLVGSSSKLQPYILAGGGVAVVKKQVTFSVGGTDVTGNLQQYGIVLGSDLSGSETKPMLTLGGGATWPLGDRLVIDLQYRFGRVFASEGGINVSRAGGGIGLRF